MQITTDYTHLCEKSCSGVLPIKLYIPAVVVATVVVTSTVVATVVFAPSDVSCNNNILILLSIAVS